ncbi:hypothetical protein CGC58_09960 [Capnocytophaga stomatis]|uniref:Uncharacterized protein n=1 Tax=Capnocytophaga stomatis TaxID=1848904 RepID=A0A250G1A1_9FLAO|nr:hypothetical protein CGC58_09960 [Capnocytophaga stomatis]
MDIFYAPFIDFLNASSPMSMEYWKSHHYNISTQKVFSLLVFLKNIGFIQVQKRIIQIGIIFKSIIRHSSSK